MSRRVALVLLAALLAAMAMPAQAQGSFRHADCPFTFALPKGATLDADGIDVNRYPDDDFINLTGIWKAGSARIAISCTKRLRYPIPPGFADHVCSLNNPSRGTGGICGKATRFDGFETFGLQSQGRVDMTYYWFYTGHKNGRGRLVMAVGSAPGAAVDAAMERDITALARRIQASIR